MAKQNVSFAERHLEKVVVGVAVAILAAVIFLYVVQDPYTIEVEGTKLGPSAFYSKLDEKVGEVANRFKSPQPVSPPEWKAPPAVAKTSTNLSVVYVPPNPAVPSPEAVQLGGKLELVQILAPGKPVITSGRAMAALAAPIVRIMGEKQDVTPPPSEKEEAKEHVWATLFATIPRRAQQEQFIKAQYALDRQHLIVAKIEVERQKMMPNGEFEEQPDRVVPFATMVLSCPPSVNLAVENGEPSIEPADHERIQSLISEASRNQANILRPDFQNQMENDFKTEWTPPAELPGGIKFDWVEDYKVILAEAEATVAATEKPSTARVSVTKMIEEITKLTDNAKAAEAKRNFAAAKAGFTQAELKVQQVLSDSGSTRLTDKDRTTLNELQAQLRIRLDQLTASESKMREVQAAEQQASLGPDTDVCWVTDTSVTPGQVYRYRVRCMAVNPHAGLLRRLKKPEDAAKVILAGEWSDWSDPIAVKSKEMLFFTGIDSATQSVKTELYRWVKGEWKPGRQNLALGQPVSWTQNLQEYHYDGVLVALESARTYEDRVLNRKKAISYKQPVPTLAVTLVNANGDVEEHLVAADMSLKREKSEELMPRKPRETQARTPGTSSREPGRGPGREPGIE